MGGGLGVYAMMGKGGWGERMGEDLFRRWGPL